MGRALLTHHTKQAYRSVCSVNSNIRTQSRMNWWVVSGFALIVMWFNSDHGLIAPNSELRMGERNAIWEKESRRAIKVEKTQNTTNRMNPQRMKHPNFHGYLLRFPTMEPPLYVIFDSVTRLSFFIAFAYCYRIVPIYFGWIERRDISISDAARFAFHFIDNICWMNAAHSLIHSTHGTHTRTHAHNGDTIWSVDFYFITLAFISTTQLSSAKKGFLFMRSPLSTG